MSTIPRYGLRRAVLPLSPETGDALDVAYDAADHRSSWSEGSEGQSYFGEWIEWHGELPAGAGRRLVHGGAIDRVIGEIDAAGLVRTYYPDAQGNVGPVAFYGPGVARRPSRRRRGATRPSGRSTQAVLVEFG